MEMQISNRSNLILSADDFGSSERANRNILYLVSMGKIDRVAVMVHGTIYEQEIRELISSGVKLDIHLDLTSHINSSEHIPALHLRVGKFLWNYLRGQYTASKVRANWEAQIEKFHQLFGKYPDGINSHEHVHFFPSFFKVVLKIQETYPIPYLRFATDSILPTKNSTCKVLALLHRFNRRKFATSSFASSNHLISLDWIENLDTFLDNPPSGSVEIVCHPHRAEEFVLVKNNF